jgi:phosphoribosylamine--glycine ligase
MKILVIGSGGREHAICWKLAQSKLVENLYACPGNPGTAQIAKNVNFDFENFENLKDFILNNSIDTVVVGPEAPLVNGIHDQISEDESLSYVNVIGPKKHGARLEGSKEFSKKFMFRHDVPTAKYQSFTAETLEKGEAFLETLTPPFVLKADGLAAGKGVLIISDLQTAKEELNNMLLEAKFGDAGSTVVIEEFLDGLEFSVFALTDGKDYVILPVAKDYKRIGEGDTGLNTGGMGAISPVSFVNDIMMQKVEERIVKPTVAGLKKDNIDYKGFIFFGLIEVKGEPFVIEYNARLGDPETEVVLPRLKSDFAELLHACGNGTLAEKKIEFDSRTAVTVMTVSGGYPGGYSKGKEIIGLEKVTNSIVFHAGTRKENNKILTSGGRVLAFTSFGDDKQEALLNSYKSIYKVDYSGMTYRKDIGFDL